MWVRRTLTGTLYTEQDLTAFAVGVEWGAVAEREACAKVAELCDDADSAARFIRARSNVEVCGAEGIRSTAGLAPGAKTESGNE